MPNVESVDTHISFHNINESKGILLIFFTYLVSTAGVANNHCAEIMVNCDLGILVRNKYRSMFFYYTSKAFPTMLQKSVLYLMRLTMENCKLHSLTCAVIYAPII